MGISTALQATHNDDLHQGNAKRGVANGLATLDALGKVPVSQVGAVELTTNKDQANGYPGLSGASKIATSQLSTNVANGIAGLDASVLLALAQQRINFHIGNFNRDMTTANGTQAVTGVGFIPRLVIFFASIASTSAVSIGADDGTTHMGIDDSHVDTATSWTYITTPIELRTAAGVRNAAYISSLDADGFTMTWTKTGAPTGIAIINYIAFR